MPLVIKIYLCKVLEINIFDKMKVYRLEDVTDQYIGKKGTNKRNSFDEQLRLDLLGQSSIQARKQDGFINER